MIMKKNNFLLLLFKILICQSYLTMDDLEEDVDVNIPVELDDGLVVTIIKRPDKCLRQASPGDHVTVHYTGRFNDANGEVFDTNLKAGSPPYRYQLGAGRVIQGYERGTPGICKGETRTLLVPPTLAYGELGVPGKIPGNSTLHFTVECLQIVEGELPPPPKPPKQKMCYERGGVKPCNSKETLSDEL